MDFSIGLFDFPIDHDGLCCVSDDVLENDLGHFGGVIWNGNESVHGAGSTNT